jgi:hypothetical protein
LGIAFYVFEVSPADETAEDLNDNVAGKRAAGRVKRDSSRSPRRKR